MAIYLKKELEVKAKLPKVNFIDKINANLPKVKVGILNLMPDLEETEKEFRSILKSKTLDIELQFIYLSLKNKSEEKKEYLKKNYRSFEEIKNTYFDGFIVTGAPLEHLDFQDINFYEEMREFLNYTKKYNSITI